jgi:phosphohistidine phosphatase SixA
MTMPKGLERMAGWGGGLAAVVLVVIAAWHSSAVAEAFPIERLDEGGYVIMLRHARAPGTGDPNDFRLGDCTTQRNLDAEGRAQAKALGERLRRAGIASAEVYSSQWCRCLETAALLRLGPVAALPALNSFYQRPDQRQSNLDALRAFLAGLPADGPLVVLVTHQVTIAAITGRAAASGEAVILEADGGAAPPVVGTIDAG